MTRLTNLEKWNNHMNALNEKANAFMDTINTLIPEIFWKVNRNGSIEECFVLNRHYSFRLHFNGKKPTNKDIEKIESVINSEIKFISDKAYFDYKYLWGVSHGKESYASTAIKVTDLFANNIAFLTLVEAEEKSRIIIEANNEEKAFRKKHAKDANYNYQKNGYKFLGWQNGWKHVYFDEKGNVTTDASKKKSFGYLKEDYPEYGNCRELKHRTIEVSTRRSGSENIVSCPICKIYWKYDCS